MFDFFRRHTRALQFILVLLVFPSFVFFGIQGYSRFNEGDQQTVARVAGQPVTQGELDAARAVEAVLGAITEALQKGDAVTLSGFGTFATKTRAARTGRNPRTGAAIDIPASKVPGFKAGKGLKDAVS